MKIVYKYITKRSVSASILIVVALFVGLFLIRGQKQAVAPESKQKVLSAQTTLTPTQKPTATPTLTPTVVARRVVLPTATQAPTATPTVSQSNNTSSNTQSNTPTSTPTTAPTPTPTSAPTSTPTPTATPSATPTPTPLGNTVEITIDYAGQKTNDSYTTTVLPGQTAWDAVVNAVGIGNVQYADYGGNLGIFITGFNGIQAAGNQYYEFRVNGVSSNVGVSSYICNNGDVLAFVLTTF